MTEALDGNAIVYCEGAFNTANGKTAHGLVRRTRRYQVLSVIDSNYAGMDAGKVLDGKPIHIPVFGSLEEAIHSANEKKNPAEFFVIGLAPDGGRLNPAARQDVRKAVDLGLNVDSGLHDFLSDDPHIMDAARKSGVKIRDVRKTPGRNELHFFSGKIEEVTALKVALLGTDSAVGKRTTAWILVESLLSMGLHAEMVGTGQTAWMQGARHCLIMDSLINDFVSGEIEHAVWAAWKEQAAEVIVIEGQGSLMNPAYPGGFEILAAGRSDIVVLQHAPARPEYDGFPGYKIHPLSRQIQVIELLSGKPVVAVTINHENIETEKTSQVCEAVSQVVGLPAFDVLKYGGENLARTVASHIEK